MGFESKKAAKCLKETDGGVDEALELLLMMM